MEQIIEQRFSEGFICPRCGEKHIKSLGLTGKEIRGIPARSAEFYPHYQNRLCQQQITRWQMAEICRVHEQEIYFEKASRGNYKKDNPNYCSRLQRQTDTQDIKWIV